MLFWIMNVVFFCRQCAALMRCIWALGCYYVVPFGVFVSLCLCVCVCVCVCVSLSSRSNFFLVVKSEMRVHVIVVFIHNSNETLKKRAANCGLSLNKRYFASTDV